ncbi:uncharacterized protein LOC132262834 [Phlebotomus argentipes]|uniref:uncharacterized protein LOC132262834 n=1 Tax=Phlebotomus argentipes TaxID=94469 RepID=UPI0028929B77|nr:uncharacterized protein LOC132262834 [Phlebotomus argentipes]
MRASVVLGYAVALTVLLVQSSDAALVYQVLPPREGYVPVYIRYGETPLDEINPNLADAFHEYGISARKIKSGLDAQMMEDQPQEEHSSTPEEPAKPAKSSLPPAAEAASEDRPQSPDAKSDKA